MAFRSFTITVAEIDSSPLWYEGHLVNRFASQLGIELRNSIKIETPVNKRANTGHGPPGNLKRSISWRKNRVAPAAKLITGTISGAYYGLWVNDGTPTITSRRRMFLPPNVVNGVSYDGRKGVKTVSGQDGDGFIDRGYAITARHHPCLR